MNEKKEKAIAKREEEQGLSLQELFQRAIETNNVDALERLMRIREELRQEKARRDFYEALKNFQEEIQAIPTDCVVRNKDGSIRYKYASIHQIMKLIQPHLAKNGLTISFNTIPTQGGVTIECILTHTSGHTEKNTYFIPLDTSPHMSDIQKWGSTLTYARRYALISMLNLVAEEDIDAIETKEEEPEIKIKKVTILDDGNVIVERKEAEKVKKETEQEVKKETDELTEKNKLLAEIKEIYKKLLIDYGYTRQNINNWLEIVHDVTLENLIECDVEKIKKVKDAIEKELKEIEAKYPKKGGK